MVVDGDGILGIWHNCRDGEEETYEHWYQSEHLIERVSIPGFHFGRRYRGIGGYRQYFVYYVTDTPDVLVSQAYLDRVNDPTPLTQKVMSGFFVDAVRTVCRRVHRVGQMDGAFAVTAVLDGPDQIADLKPKLTGLLDGDGRASMELWEAVEGASDTGSREQKIRGGDKTISACLFATVLRERDALDLADALKHIGIGGDQIGMYAALCELRREQLCLTD